jgi:hypothetical protein
MVLLSANAVQLYVVVLYKAQLHRIIVVYVHYSQYHALTESLTVAPDIGGVHCAWYTTAAAHGG